MEEFTLEVPQNSYCQISDIRHTFVGNKIVYHSDVVGALPVGTAPTTVFILDLSPGFNRLRKDNCKTKQETFKFGDLVYHVLEVWR